jgi:hypothetical protein
LTAGTTSIGVTKVHDAAAGMVIKFAEITTSSNIQDELIPAAASTSLTRAENYAVAALSGPSIAYFTYHGNDCFIATKNTESAVRSGDAIVELVKVAGLIATDASGLVTLHPGI